MKRFNKYKFFKDIKYIPHEGQKQFHNSKARFRFMTCGRRWGKSLGAAMEAMGALVEKPNQMGWVVAPDYELSMKIFREVYWSFHKHTPWLVISSSLSKGNMHIKLKNGSMLIGKSADNPVSLIGEGLNFLIVDEASRIKSDVWYEALRPTLTDKKGWALFISTPTGKNWFYEDYIRGVNGEPDYESWHFTSYTNPHLDPTEIDQAKDKIPSDKFKQEYLAEFLEIADSYFTTELINSCIDPEPKYIDCRHGNKSVYNLGVDCARMGQDESVVIVIESLYGVNKVVFIKSFATNTITQLSNFVKYLDKQFNFQRMYIDMAGLGAGVYDELNSKMPGRVDGCKFTVKEKQDIYSNLKMNMEKKNLLYHPNKKLIEQLKDLRYETMPSGDIKIHHSEYGFDDYPDALALACWALRITVAYRPLLGK